jgi:hypothetical protein
MCIGFIWPTLETSIGFYVHGVKLVCFATFIEPSIVICFYSKTNQMHQFFKFILFCSSTLHVSDGLSVHHQESKTVHTASGMCQTDSADCLLAGTRWNCSNLFYFVVALFMFRTVFPFIIRSLRLYIQHQVCARQILLTAC